MDQHSDYEADNIEDKIKFVKLKTRKKGKTGIIDNK